VAKKENKEGKGAEQAKKGKKGEAAEAVQIPSDYEPRLLKQYKERIVPALMKRFGLKNVMEAPRLEKVILNVGMGEAHQDQKLLDSVLDELAVITGQKPVVTRAKKSISNFKLRAGMQVGARVTLRRWQMYEFVDKLFSLATPRIRDFRGLPDKSFDGRGNYTIGIKEQIVFPEIDYDKVEKIHGLDITFVTTAPNDEQAYALLEELGCPFRKRQGAAQTAAVGE
jgi:large subunit ribosomal protein L5